MLGWRPWHYEGERLTLLEPLKASLLCPAPSGALRTFHELQRSGIPRFGE